MDASIVFWGPIVIFGVPALALILGECIHFCERRGSRLTPMLRYLRGYILPSIALWVLMERLLQIADSLPLKLVETGFWMAAIVTLLALLNAVLTTGKVPPGTLQIQVPNLFFQALRGLVVLGILAHLLGDIWQVNVEGIMTALGVGSLAIALALQETLSNLVSGFLLLFSKPFRIGDWIEANGITGKVVDISWRSTLLETVMGDTYEIPNGALGGATIRKYPSATPTSGAERVATTWCVVKAGFDRDDPPNRAIEALTSAATGIDGVLDIFPTLASYDEYWTTYELWLLTPVEKAWTIQVTINARIYYAAKRYGLTMPIEDMRNRRSRPDRRLPMGDYLRSLPYLATLDPAILDNLAQEAKMKFYGSGEPIITAGEPDEGLYIIREGSIALAAKDVRGGEQEIDRVVPGSFFGEMALLGEPSPVSAIALDDVEAIVIPPELARRAIDSSSRLTQEIDKFIEERKQAIRRVQGIGSGVETNGGKVVSGKRSLLERLSRSVSSSSQEEQT